MFEVSLIQYLNVLLCRIAAPFNSRIKLRLSFRDQSGSAGRGKSSDSFNALFGLRLY